MATTSDIRKGLMIRLQNDVYEVIDFLHVKPGKGQAFVRTKLKSVTTGKVIDKTFSVGTTIEDVQVEHRPYQYIYQDGDNYVFMHMQTYEQIPIPKEQIEGVEFLKEGMECDVIVDADNEKILKVQLPQFAILEVTYTEPGVRGDTVTNVMKPATLETGAQIKVPLFINIGDKVKVNTRTGEYVERAKTS